MKYFIYSIFFSFIIAGATADAQRPFTAGNIVVYRVGDGASALNATAAPVYLDEYTTGGILVQSILMPTSASGNNSILTAKGNDLDGMLSLSANGKYLVVPGSIAPVGTSPSGNTVTIGLVDFNGTINTSTSVTDVSSAGGILNAAASTDGNSLWLGRYDALKYTTTGSHTSTTIFSGFDEIVTAVTIANGQLYFANEADNPKIRKVGTGLPVSGGQSSSALPGLLSSQISIPRQFAFADINPNEPGADVLYVADMGSIGGIKKFSLVNGNWTANGIVGTVTDRYAGLTVTATGNIVTVFATRLGANTLPVRGGELVKLTDNSGHNGTLTATPVVLASAATPNTISFRGVALVPQPAPFTAGNIVVYRAGDGVAALTSTAAPVFLDEYTTNGVLVQSIKMPTIAFGTNNILTAKGNDLDGLLSLSSNGKYLVVPGSIAPVGTAISGTTVTVGLVDFNAMINTSTAITNVASSGGILHSAASDDGNRLWFGRYDAIRYSTAGSTTSVALTSADEFLGAFGIADGQLYASLENPSPRIVKVGTGLPSAGNQPLTGLPGLTSIAARNPKQFAFADLDPSTPGSDVLYIADFGTSTGGLKKLSLVAGTWVDNGVIGTAADGYVGLTVSTSGNTVTIYATRRGPNSASVRGGELVKLLDNSGYNGALTATPLVIASAAVINATSFRGVAKVPLGCTTVFDPVVFNITPAAATISWTGNSPNGFEYAVTSSQTPPSAGTLVNNNSVPIAGLSNNTSYYAHIRVVCSASQNSEWISIPFTTGCKAPAPPQINVAVSSAGIVTIKWNTIFGAASYQYYISASAIPPATGADITDTLVTTAALNSVTQYYIHVRSNCGGGAFSNWSTKPFTTSCFMPAPALTLSPDNATIKWSSIINADRYEYAFSHSAAKPQSGYQTADTFFLSGKLDAGSRHYFHVRSICSNGLASGWSTIKLTVKGLEVYPSPVKESLTIALHDVNNSTGIVTVYDVIGKIVKRIQLTGSPATVNVAAWPQGIYLLSYDDKTTRYTVRVMKE